MRVINLEGQDTGGLNVCIVGAPGVGKTRFVGSASQQFNTVVFDTENGYKTLFKDKDVVDTSKLSVLQYTQFSDLDRFYQLCRANDPVKWSDALGKKILEPMEVVAIDTGSELNKLMVEAIKPVNVSTVMKSLRDIPSLQIQDWGKVLELFRMMTKEFCKLPVHFIITVHEQIIQDEYSGKVFGQPLLNGKLAQDYGKYFDVYSHLTVNSKGQYVLVNRPVGIWTSRTRIDIPEVISDPKFTDIIPVKH